MIFGSALAKGLAIALAASLLAHAGQALHAWKLRADVTKAEAATTRATAERDKALGELADAQANARTCGSANTSWQLVTLELQTELASCQRAHAAQAAQGRAAAERLDRQLAAANAALAAQRDRQAAARGDAACAALLDTRFADVCPGLSGGAR